MIPHIFLGPFGLGGPEMTLIVIALLLMFGGKKIPELMKGLGKGIKEFKDASSGVDEQNKNTPENNGNKGISSEHKA